MIKEEWKSIDGFYDMYYVSSHGNVKSFKKSSNVNNVILSDGSKLMIPKIDKYGYLRVRLSKNGKRKPYLLHRLVANAFLQNTDLLPCVNHKNEIKTDNNVVNLEWCDVNYNNHYNDRYQKIKRFTRPVVKYTLDMELVQIFNSIVSASKSLNINRKESNISSCCRGKIKYAYGFIWRYYDKK